MKVCRTVLWCNKGPQHSEAVDLHLGLGTQVGQPGGGCQLGFPHASQKIEVHYLHARRHQLVSSDSFCFGGHFALDCHQSLGPGHLDERFLGQQLGPQKLNVMCF